MGLRRYARKFVPISLASSIVLGSLTVAAQAEELSEENQALTASTQEIVEQEISGGTGAEDSVTVSTPVVEETVAESSTEMATNGDTQAVADSSSSESSLTSTEETVAESVNIFAEVSDEITNEEVVSEELAEEGVLENEVSTEESTEENTENETDNPYEYEEVVGDNPPIVSWQWDESRPAITFTAEVSSVCDEISIAYDNKNAWSSRELATGAYIDLNTVTVQIDGMIGYETSTDTHNRLFIYFDNVVETVTISWQLVFADFTDYITSENSIAIWYSVQAFSISGDDYEFTQATGLINTIIPESINYPLVSTIDGSISATYDNMSKTISFTLDLSLEEKEINGIYFTPIFSWEGASIDIESVLSNPYISDVITWGGEYVDGGVYIDKCEFIFDQPIKENYTISWDVIISTPSKFADNTNTFVVDENTMEISFTIYAYDNAVIHTFVGANSVVVTGDFSEFVTATEEPVNPGVQTPSTPAVTTPVSNSGSVGDMNKNANNANSNADNQDQVAASANNAEGLAITGVNCAMSVLGVAILLLASGALFLARRQKETI